jgi:transcriptional regulator of acetoin/glycerol metabolism
MPPDPVPYVEHPDESLDPRVWAAWQRCMVQCLARHAKPGKRLPNRVLSHCRRQAIMESFAVAEELGLIARHRGG